METIMLKKDNIIIGLAIGFLLPFLLIVISEAIFRMRGMRLDPSFYENYSLFMIGLNGLVMRYFTVNREQDQTGKGIIISTLILAIVWVVKYQM